MTARARELLEIVGKATPGIWFSGRDGVWSTYGGVEVRIGSPCISEDDEHAICHLHDLAAELRAALDEIERLRGALLTGAGLLEQGCNAMDMAASMRRVLEQNASHTAEIGKACRDE